MVNRKVDACVVRLEEKDIDWWENATWMNACEFGADFFADMVFSPGLVGRESSRWCYILLANYLCGVIVSHAIENGSTIKSSGRPEGCSTFHSQNVSTISL
jgi:hypothetical protein